MKKHDFIVYKTTDLKTGKIYIGYDSYNRSDYFGSGSYFNNVVHKRIKLYIEQELNETFDEKKYKEYKKKYQFLFFSKEILEHYNTKEEMIFDEPNWIKKLNATNKTIGYNIIDTETWGDTFTNNPNKEKIRKKMSKATKGEKNPMCGKGYLLEGEKNGMYNKNHKKESCELISKKNKVKLLGNKNFGDTSGEKNPMYNTCAYKIWIEKYGIEEAKRREKLKNKKISETIIKNNCNKGSNNGMYEKNNYNIWIKKYGKDIADQKQKERGKLISKKLSKEICQYDKNNNLIKIFNSLTEAFKNTKIPLSTICWSMKKIDRFAGGYKWKYKQ